MFKLKKKSNQLPQLPQHISQLYGNCYSCNEEIIVDQVANDIYYTISCKKCKKKTEFQKCYGYYRNYKLSGCQFSALIKIHAGECSGCKKLHIEELQEERERKNKEELERKKEELERKKEELEKKKEWGRGIRDIDVSYNTKFGERIVYVNKEPVGKYKEAYVENHKYILQRNSEVLLYMIHQQSKQIDIQSEQIKLLHERFDKMMEMIEFAPGGEEYINVENNFNQNIKKI